MFELIFSGHFLLVIGVKDICNESLGLIKGKGADHFQREIMKFVDFYRVGLMNRFPSNSSLQIE